MSIGQEVQFPVQVDPVVVGYYGQASGGSWPHWGFYQSCGCVSGGGSGYGLSISTGSTTEGFGDWHVESGNSEALITRVDLSGASHTSAAGGLYTYFDAGTYPSGEHAIYSYESTNPNASRPGAVATTEEFGGRSIAFCDYGAGGYDGGAQPLCDERYGAEGFAFYLAHPGQTLVSGTAFSQIEDADVHYVQTTPPNEPLLEGPELVGNSWTRFENPGTWLEGSDGGTGIAAMGVNVGAGERSVNELPEPPGSKPVPGTGTYSPTCNDPFCPEWAGHEFKMTGLATGTWTLGAWTENAVGLAAEKSYVVHVDKTPPLIPKPSWAGTTIGDKPTVLTLFAQDGYLTQPQAGVESIDVLMDGRDIYEDVKSISCPPNFKEPEYPPLLPALRRLYWEDRCYALLGNYTLDGEDFGAGPHTITLRARDWVGNVSERSFTITIEHHVNDTQSVGPGSLNLLNGDYRLSTGDVSLPAGTATLAVSRSYDSRSIQSGPLGPGWSLGLPDTSAGGQWRSLKVLPEGGIEATTTTGQNVLFTKSGNGFSSPSGYQNYTLTEPTTSPVVYQITDSAGDYTQFEEPAGATSFMPTSVAQSSGAGGLNAVKYVIKEGKTSEVFGPSPTGENCASSAPEEWTKTRTVEEEHRGCRALVLHYASATSASGEARGGWGNYKGQLESVSFTGYDPSSGKERITTTSVAQYEYDAKGRLRAEWDPRIASSTDCTNSCEALKSTYGYDEEGHLTALSPPGQQPWLLSYGVATKAEAGEEENGACSGASCSEYARQQRLNHARLIRAMRLPASTALWGGEALSNTQAPVISGSPIEAVRMGVSNGAWSGSPHAFAYQWEQCNAAGEGCEPIAGATNENYTPNATDVGHTLRAQVVALSAAGATSAASGVSQVVQAPGSPPSEAQPFAPQEGTTIEYGVPVVSGVSGAPRPSTQWAPEGFLTFRGASGSPQATSVDSNGDAWAVGYTHSLSGPGVVKEYTPQGQILHEIGTSFCLPQNVSADLHGDVFVSEGVCQRVQEFNSEGKLVRQFPANGSDGKYVWGTEVAAGPEGNLWETTMDGHILELSEAGVYEHEFAGFGASAGQLEEPRGLAVEAGGNFWVADTANNRVDQFSSSGAFIKAIGFGVLDGASKQETCTTATGCQAGLPGAGEGQLSHPAAVAVDAGGHFFAADAGNARIEEYSSSTDAYLASYGEKGTGAGQLQSPTSVSLDSTGNIWVNDTATDELSSYTGSKEPVAPPYAMGAREVEAWGQSEAPTQAAAIFPPDEPQSYPASDYRRATIYYFDSFGRRVDVAAPGGAIATTEYDSYDNVDRTLTPGNRQRALEAGAGSAAQAKLLDTETEYSADGSELLSSVGPQHEVKLANGTTTQARARTRHFYDEGAPTEEHRQNGSESVEVPYRLVTKSTEGALLPGGSEEEVRAITDSYSGQSNLGWKLRKPTSVTTEPEPGKHSTRTTVYNAGTGDVTESTSPAGAGKPSSPHTVQTVYYTSGTEAAVSACQKRPEWAGSPCQTQPASQPETVGLPKLPVSTVTYNLWGEPLESMLASGANVKTTTTMYDAAGRAEDVSVSSTTGHAVAPTTNKYNAQTGALVKQSAVINGQAEAIESVYNSLGQLTSYSDADHNVSTYEYDIDGRPTKVFDGKGTQTYTYDPTSGLLATLVDSAAGTFAGTYDVEGELQTETYPNGMTASYERNAVGQATRLAYVKGRSTWYQDQVSLSIHGQWLNQQTTQAADSYAYDSLGRMVATTESPNGKPCVAYLYSYDEESDRISETKREGTPGSCPSQGGSTTTHAYDEANRLIDSGAEYEPLGAATKVPATDAGGHTLESSYYASGALYTEAQNSLSKTYQLDPTGRARETLSEEVGSSAEVKHLVSHYSSSNDMSAWTEEAHGAFTRDVAGIGGAICAVQTSTEVLLEISNLHGDVVGTVSDNQSAEPKLTSEPTAFGVPTAKASTPYSWLGSSGLKVEFESGVSGEGGGTYIPQLGVSLAPSELSGSASQDPINEYLSDREAAQPTGARVTTMPGAIEPLPVNQQMEDEFWANPPWDQSPTNEVGEGISVGGDPNFICEVKAPTPAEAKRRHGHLKFRGGYVCWALTGTGEEELDHISALVQVCAERQNPDVPGGWEDVGHCNPTTWADAPVAPIEFEHWCYAGSIYRVWVWVYWWGAGPMVTDPAQRRSSWTTCP